MRVTAEKGNKGQGQSIMAYFIPSQKTKPCISSFDAFVQEIQNDIDLSLVMRQ